MNEEIQAKAKMNSAVNLHSILAKYFVTIVVFVGGSILAPAKPIQQK